VSDERKALAALAGSVVCPSCQLPAQPYRLGDDSGTLFYEGCFVWVSYATTGTSKDGWWCPRCSAARNAEVERRLRKGARSARWPRRPKA